MSMLGFLSHEDIKVTPEADVLGVRFGVIQRAADDVLAFPDPLAAEKPAKIAQLEDVTDVLEGAALNAVLMRETDADAVITPLVILEAPVFNTPELQISQEVRQVSIPPTADNQHSQPEPEDMTEEMRLIKIREDVARSFEAGK